MRCNQGVCDDERYRSRKAAALHRDSFWKLYVWQSHLQEENSARLCHSPGPIMVSNPQGQTFVAVVNRLVT